MSDGIDGLLGIVGVEEKFEVKLNFRVITATVRLRIERVPERSDAQLKRKAQIRVTSRILLTNII